MPKPCVQGRERWAEHTQAWGQTRFGEPHRPAWGAGISLHHCGNPRTSSQRGLPWSDGLFSAVFLADIWNVMWWGRVGLWRQADLCSDPKSTFSEHLHHGPVAVSKPVSILLPQAGWRLHEVRHTQIFSTVLGPEEVNRKWQCNYYCRYVYSPEVSELAYSRVAIFHVPLPPIR